MRRVSWIARGINVLVPVTDYPFKHLASMEHSRNGIDRVFSCQTSAWGYDYRQFDPFRVIGIRVYHIDRVCSCGSGGHPKCIKGLSYSASSSAKYILHIQTSQQSLTVYSLNMQPQSALTISPIASSERALHVEHSTTSAVDSSTSSTSCINHTAPQCCHCGWRGSHAPNCPFK